MPGFYRKDRLRAIVTLTLMAHLVDAIAGPTHGDRQVITAATAAGAARSVSGAQPAAPSHRSATSRAAPSAAAAAATAAAVPSE